MTYKKYFKDPLFTFTLIKSKLLSTIYKSNLQSLGEKTFFKGRVWFFGEKYISIGKRCSIGPYCRIEAFKNSFNDRPKLAIGDFTSLQHAVHIYCANSLEIGNSVLIASGCMITDNNHGINPIGEIYIRQDLDCGKTIIEDEVWLGENVCVLKNSRIGKRSIIGANSVVSGYIPEYSIAAGNPAKVIKKYNFETNKWEKV